MAVIRYIGAIVTNMANRVFKSSRDFKATNDSAVNEKGAIIQGSVTVENGELVCRMPLVVTEAMIRLYTEPVSRNGAEVMVDKGGLVVACVLPEGLEVTVSDWMNAQGEPEARTFRVKRGGMASTRYINLGFDPNQGYKRVNTTENIDEFEEEAQPATA